MKYPKPIKVILVAALLTFAIVIPVGAQNGGEMSHMSYFLAPDANGIYQVFQLLVDNQSEPRQITHADRTIMTFGAAYDGLSVAYIADGGLWLQSIHNVEAELLAPISATQFFSGPVFSQDGQYIAYPDNGVWLFNLATRETTQLLANVAIDPSASNTDALRLYQPQSFVLGADGKVAQLIVNVGVWEWNTAGVFDLETGELQVLEGRLHTDLLPLDDGRVLLYGNGGVAGEPALHIADSLDDINANTELISFAAFTDAIIHPTQATEIQPGVVRIFGSAASFTPSEVNVFTFDYDLIAGTAGEVTIINLSKDSAGNTVPGEIAPDGRLVSVYFNALWAYEGIIYGELKLFDLETGEAMAVTFPPTVSIFRWQP